MSNEFYEEMRNPSKDNSDRYKNCKLLKDQDTREVLLSTREVIDIPVSTRDNYHRVQSHEVSRLDIIAQTYYKNPLLWWIIAQANNIKDPFISITPGSLLRIPAIETLYGNNGILL